MSETRDAKAERLLAQARKYLAEAQRAEYEAEQARLALERERQKYLREQHADEPGATVTVRKRDGAAQVDEPRRISDVGARRLCAAPDDADSLDDIAGYAHAMRMLDAD